MQQIEYEKTFNISRNVFNLLDANCLISGAFGIFRKKEFTAVNGYDPDTVGEDMELALRLQEMLKPTGKKSFTIRKASAIQELLIHCSDC